MAMAYLENQEMLYLDRTQDRNQDRHQDRSQDRTNSRNFDREIERDKYIQVKNKLSTSQRDRNNSTNLTKNANQTSHSQNVSSKTQSQTTGKKPAVNNHKRINTVNKFANVKDYYPSSYVNSSSLLFNMSSTLYPKHRKQPEKTKR